MSITLFVIVSAEAADMELVTGKSRTDKYWARSQTLLEKVFTSTSFTALFS